MTEAAFRPAVVGIAGPRLDPAERELFAALPPAGFILFRRNCLEPAQLAALVAELRALAPGRQVPLFVDQEGGRVQRLVPPHWPDLPAAGTIGRIFARDPARGREAARLWAACIAAIARGSGFDVVCAPVLDLRLPETTGAIGDRSFGGDPEQAAALGRIVCETFARCGVLPVIKHLPGHGRAEVDSHLALPRVTAPLAVLAATDFVPFHACRDAPFAMTCHCLFEAVDPGLPASLSPTVVREVVRERIGFGGILLSDDLCMGALDGLPAERARAALRAGNDLVLWCDGDTERTAAVLEALPPAPGALARRLDTLLAGTRRAGAETDVADLVHRLGDAISRADVRDA